MHFYLFLLSFLPLVLICTAFNQWLSQGTCPSFQETKSNLSYIIQREGALLAEVYFKDILNKKFRKLVRFFKDALLAFFAVCSHQTQLAVSC